MKYQLFRLGFLRNLLVHSMRKIPSCRMLKLVVQIVPHSTSNVNQLSFTCGVKISQQISQIGKLKIITEMINTYENGSCYLSGNISATRYVSYQNYIKSTNFNTNTDTKFNRNPLNNLRQTCLYIDKGPRSLHYEFPAYNVRT
jgi:hypothetical protein